MPSIRRARTDDGPGLQAAHSAAIRVSCRTHYAPEDIEVWAGRLAPEAYAADIAQRDVIVAEDAGRILGLGVLDRDRAEIRAVYVHPDVGRCGVGGRLLNVLEGIARLRGLAHLTLDSSLNAVAFYTSAGFRTVRDTTHTFPGGRDIACVVMTKTLAPLRLAIRDEVPADVDGIHRVEHAAFDRDAEAVLVDRLRAAGVLSLSLVAALDDEVIGHVAFSPVAVAGAAGSVVGSVLGLAPVAVAPAYQRCAVGARLCEEGLARARERGHDAVVVLGHPAYYPRFGFVPASGFGLSYPGAVLEEAFMAAELSPGALASAAGPVQYRPEFEAVESSALPRA